DKERHYIEDNYYDDSYKKKPAIVEIKKELFVCDNIVNVTAENRFFNCITEPIPFEGGFERTFISPPDSDKYISCDDIGGCPGIDESDYKVEVFGEATVLGDLSQILPTSVDLTKINYFVTEDETEDRIDLDSPCFESGFEHSANFLKFVMEEGVYVDYEVCALYEGDCQGEISPGEVKECTVKNFIHEGEIDFVAEDIPEE
ncbi:MAG: hypothetical protein ACPKPY_12870, partial [Nitrososphaeraceae archaeon]